MRAGRSMLRASAWRRFARRRDGNVAIEFAALVIPFSLLVFAILESGLSFGAQQMLANATDDVARQFRTGQIRPADLMADTKLVHDRICKKIEILVTSDCPGLEVDLKSYDSFDQAAARRIRYKSDGDLDTDDFGLDPGRSGTKNQLRVFYRWPVITDFMRKSMSNLPGGKTLLFASVTWQNEPFDD